MVAGRRNVGSYMLEGTYVEEEKFQCESASHYGIISKLKSKKIKSASQKFVLFRTYQKFHNFVNSILWVR